MKVFLSSTYEDLVEYRAKAAQAIERLGQRGIRMEVFGARAQEASDVCVGEKPTEPCLRVHLFFRQTPSSYVALSNGQG
jgi:hypothetical protein